MIKYVSIIGTGFVGSIMKKSFELKGLKVKTYDKYKKCDTLQECLNSEIIFIAVPTQYNEKKLLTRKEKKVIIESELNETKKDIKYKDRTIKELRKKERDYKNFVRKLGAKELSDLNPDEIKVKLDQILDWNDNSNKPKKYVEVENDRFNRKKNKQSKEGKVQMFRQRYDKLLGQSNCIFRK